MRTFFISSHHRSAKVLYFVHWLSIPKILSPSPNSSFYTTDRILSSMAKAPSQHSKHRYKKGTGSKFAERKDRHTTSMMACHVVLTPKYRAKVLKGGVAIECERQIRWTCKVLDVKILEMAVAEDHVHLFIQYSPKLATSRIVEAIKANSSRELRKKYPQLVKWCPKALWAPGCYHGSVGQGFEVVEHYISGQQQYRANPGSGRRPSHSP